MLFSIIVPIYKVEKYIHRCIDSLINQTFFDIEIILIDDGSPDNCPRICDEYSERYENIRVIHKENGGLSDARNCGIRAASGEYIIFVDSDDYISLDACEKFSRYTADKYDVIVADSIVKGAEMDLSHIKSDKSMNGHEYLLNSLRMNKAPMVAWLNIYRRDFLINNNLFFKYGILHEDEHFTPRVFLKAGSVFVTDVVFYHYIIREDSITTKKDKRKNADDLFNSFCELEKIYHKLDEPELKRYLLNSMSEGYLRIFRDGKLFVYGKDFLHKDFVYRNALFPRTKLKSLLHCFSPRIYYYISILYNKLRKVLLRLDQNK